MTQAMTYAKKHSAYVAVVKKGWFLFHQKISSVLALSCNKPLLMVMFLIIQMRGPETNSLFLMVWQNSNISRHGEVVSSKRIGDVEEDAALAAHVLGDEQ